jgi:hypothetical protein
MCRIDMQATCAGYAGCYAGHAGDDASKKKLHSISMTKENIHTRRVATAIGTTGCHYPCDRDATLIRKRTKRQSCVAWQTNIRIMRVSHQHSMTTGDGMVLPLLGQDARH